MKKAFIIGERVYLRPLEREDLGGRYREWVNDPEVVNFLATGAYPQTDDDLIRYYENNVNSRSQVLFAIVEKDSDTHIGNARIYGIDWLNKKAHRGILIGEKSCWSKGYGKEVINLLSVYAFDKLNLRKLSSTTVGNNAGIIKVNEACGYRQEGILREEFFRDGVYYDVLYWGLLRSDYQRNKSS